MALLNFKTDIVQYPMPENQYVKEVTDKTGIVLHGTASNEIGKNVFDYWNSNKERVATCVVVASSGVIYQGYSSKYWAGHIGLAHGLSKWKLPYQDYSKTTIGIEIANWGFLTKKGDKFYSWTGAEVPASEVIEYPNLFKQNRFYERYTKEQIDAVEKLLRYWNKIYGIPLVYNEKDMWDLSLNAHKNVPGVYSHNSYRLDKSDIHPQPEMIAMLQSL